MDDTVGIHLYSINHADHGLAAVERVAAATPGLARRLVEGEEGVRGAVVLSTCNRLEVYVDADATGSPGRAAVQRAIAAGLSEPTCPEHLELRSRHEDEVLWHLFGVGAGLDSMVVGEREIAGQLRRALKQARRDQTATYLLTESIEQALRTSRRIAHRTDLADNGRSVVAVGLDLLERRWVGETVLLLGTGAYAGAVVAALRARGCTDIRVFSSSGRAAAFAESHGVQAVTGDLVDALAKADVAITCRGVGRPIVTVAAMSAALEARNVAAPLDVVDLAIARDVEPGVGDLAGVRLLDLTVIQRHVPDASAREIARAERLVAQGVNELMVRLKSRQLDPAVVALRDQVTAMVDDEIGRLPTGRPLTSEDAAHALRRLAARMIHEPSVRAHRAAETGEGEEYRAALARVWGIDVPLAEFGMTVASAGLVPHGIDPDRLDGETCPVTGFTVDGFHDERETA